MSRLKVSDLPLEGLKLIQREILDDERGFLSRLFCADELARVGWNEPIAQVNHTLTLRRGCVRGMHYQEAPHSDAKLVTCIRGEIWDVAVDLRTNSSTFLKYHGQVLSEKNCSAMLIPVGFAHGFQTMKENCELIYLHTSSYKPEAERGLRYDDPNLAINWPCPVTLVSQRDQFYQLLMPSFRGISSE